MSIDSSVSSVKVAEDEIDLVQLWQILVRRKSVTLVCILLCLAAGLAYAFVNPDKFEYTTAIDIGSVSGTKILSPDQGLALLQKTFIPQINGVILEKHDEQAPDTSAVIPKGSQLIVLTSRGGLEAVERIRESHALAFEALKRETQKAVDTAHKNLVLQVEDANLQLQALEDPQVQATAEKALIVKLSEEKLQLSKLGEQENYLDSQEKQLENAQVTLSQQIAESEKSMEEAFKARPAAVANMNDTTKAMTMLMINNQIQTENTRLADLKERLTIGIAEKRHQLKQGREDLKGSKQTHALEIDRLQSELTKLKINLTINQAKQKNIISTTENKLNEIYETRAIGMATRTAKPIGLGKVGIMIYSAVIGAMGGVMCAFFVEFVKSARRRSSTGVM